MKTGLLRTQINECSVILKQLGMDNEFVPYPSYPTSPRAFFKGLLYSEVWKKCLQNRYYHFQLHDNSLIYFASDSDRAISLSYYEYPYDAMTYDEFIVSYDFTYGEIGEELREEYGDYLTTCDIKESINNVRYDLCYDQYVEGKHPVSHIHIGYNGNIRIRTERIMGPLSFLMFIIRQHYPDYWEKYTVTKKKQTLLNIVRDKLDTVNSSSVTELDKCELFLC